MNDNEPSPTVNEEASQALAGDGEDGGLKGRRLQLIPHSVDPRYVFRFEFGPAILAQVREKLEGLPLIPLADVTGEKASYPGFYQLFRNGESVYVGRTIRPVAQRLAEHARKLRGRIPLNEMTARYLFVEDLSLVGLSEDSLIAYFYPLKLDPWGKQGFGSKATGFGRARQASNWHAANPADLTFAVRAGHDNPRLLRQLIQTVAAGAPLTLSIPTEYRSQFDAEHAVPVVMPLAELPFGEWIKIIEQRLAERWSIRREAMAWYIIRKPEEEA